MTYKWNNIQHIRWKKKMSLEQLSKLSGVSVGAINMIENFQRIPSQRTMLLLSKSLNMNTEEVFNLDWRKLDL